MSLENEFAVLMRSDMAAGSLDQITTRLQVWLSNTGNHFFAAFFGYHAWHRFKGWFARTVILTVIGFYIVVQIWNLSSLGNPILVTADSFLDLIIVPAGICLAWSWAMRGVQL